MGCKVYIRRSGSDGEEERLAEILSIRDRSVNPYANGTKGVKEEALKPEDQWEYFVHWDSFNKRLDGWVPGSRLVLSRDLEWPRPKAASSGKKTTVPPQKAPSKAPRSLLKRATTNAALVASPTPGIGADYAPSPSPAPINLKRKAPDDEEVEEEAGEEEEAEPDDEDADAEGEMDVDGEGEVETFD